MTKKEAEQVLDAVLDSIGEALSRGESIDLRGFGSFRISEKKERQGRNPRTGETLTIAARRAAVFKPSRELNELLGAPMAQPSSGPAKAHGDKILSESDQE
jgi:nucleoid DNA-binding protein